MTNPFSSSKIIPAIDKMKDSPQFARVQTKHRNSIQHTRIELNTQAMQTLSNAAMRVKNILSDFLEKADPEDKQVFDIEEQIRNINDNFKPSDAFLTMPSDNLWRRSRTKGFVYSKKKKEDGTYSRQKLSSKDIKKNKPFNTALLVKDDSLKKTNEKYSFHQEQDNQTKNINNSQFKRRSNRRQSYQTQSPIFFDKVLENNQKENEANKAKCDTTNSNSNIKPILKHSKGKGLQQSLIRETSKMIKLVEDTDRHKDTQEKEIEKKDENDITNFIPLNNTKLKAFNDICTNIRESIILSPEIAKKLTDKQQAIKAKENPNEHEDEIATSDEEQTMKNRKKEIKEIKYRGLSRNKNLVYDSLSDEEVDDEIAGIFYFKPDSWFKLMFDGILIPLTFYSFILTPYSLAFDFYLGVPITSYQYIMDIIVDAFFGLDVIMGFFTAYYDFEEQLITRLKPIAKNYLLKWFLIDLICGIPFNTMLPGLNHNKKYNFIITYISDNSKLVQLLMIVRLLKLFKVFYLNSCIAIIHKFALGIDILANSFRLFIYLLLFLLSVHCLSCVFIFLGQLDYPNWLSVQGLEFNQPLDIYIASFYYICATVFTIGYGDILSVSIHERFYNLFLLVVGIMIYSWAVTSLSNWVQSVDSKTSDYQKKVAILEEIKATHEKLPSSLYDKISRFLSYDFLNEKKDKKEIIDNLPLSLRNLLIMEMYKSIINNFVFFKNFDNSDFIIQVILALKPLQVTKGEKLVNEGDYLEDIIFVKRGSLSLEIPLPLVIKDETIQTLQNNNSTFNFTKSLTTTKTFAPDKIEYGDTNNFLKKKINSTMNQFKPNVDQQYIKIIEIRRNEHFGDILMFLNRRSPLTVKVRSKVAEIFVLKKTDAVEISMQFPRIWRKIIKKSLFNMEQIERLINKALRFFFIHNEGNQISKQKKNYYHRDFTKKNTLLNSNKLFNTLNDDACELQSIPSSEEVSEDSDSDDFIKEEDSVIQEVDQENEEDEKRTQSNYVKNIIKEEDEDDEDEDDNEDDFSDSNSNAISKKEEFKCAFGKIKSKYHDSNSDNESNDNTVNKSISIDNITIKMNISNTKVNFDEDETKGKHLSEKYHTKHSSSLIENSIIDNHNPDSHNKEKGTELYSQINTMPFSYEEINQENYPDDISIDLKDNSFIPSIMPKESNDNMSNNGNNNAFIYHGNFVHYFNNSEQSRHISRNIKDNSSRSGKLPEIEASEMIIFGDLKIEHLNDFSIYSNLPPKTPKSPQEINDNIIKFTTTKNRNSFKSPKIISLQKNCLTDCDSPIDQRKASKMMFYQHKDSFLKEKSSSTRIRKNYTNRPSMTGNQFPLQKQISKIPKTTNSSNMLDVISKNIERNSLMLNNPKFFYSNYFSQVKNQEDGRESSKAISKKLSDIVRLIELNNPEKKKFKNTSKSIGFFCQDE